MNIHVPVIVPEERVPELYLLVATWLRECSVTPVDVAPPPAPWTVDDVDLAVGLARSVSRAASRIIGQLALGKPEEQDEPGRGAWVVDPDSGERAWGLPADVLARLSELATPAALVGCLGSLSRACAKVARRSLFFSAWATPQHGGDSSWTEPRPVRYYGMPPATAQVFLGRPHPNPVRGMDGDLTAAGSSDDDWLEAEPSPPPDESDEGGFHDLTEDDIDAVLALNGQRARDPSGF